MKYNTNKGILVEEYDEIAENPRSRDYDEGIFTTFFTFSKNYKSPDEHNYSDFKRWMYDILSKKAADEIDALFWKNEKTDACKLLIASMKKRGYILLPVFKYEHGEISYQAGTDNPYSCPWDSGLIGVIYCSKKDLWNIYKKNITKSFIEEINNMMIAEVEEYSNYANGNVYCYYFENENDVVYSSYYGDISKNGILDSLEISEYSIIN